MDHTIKNPAKSRPLSSNVRRLMKLARESPDNPEVRKADRSFGPREQAYCDMQGNIFMAALDRSIPVSTFAPIFMRSQLAGVIDYSFSVAGGMEEDDLSEYLKIPMLVHSPQLLVDVVMWLDDIVHHTEEGISASMAVIKACLEDSPEGTQTMALPDAQLPMDEKELADLYEYAYFLGFMYRCDCLLHDESSRMVFGAFSEKDMHDFYLNLPDRKEMSLLEQAPAICRKLDAQLVGKLWK